MARSSCATRSAASSGCTTAPAAAPKAGFELVVRLLALQRCVQRSLPGPHQFLPVVGPSLAHGHTGAGDAGDVGVEGIGRLEDSHGAAGAAIGQAQGLDDLVGPVPGQDLFRPHPVELTVIGPSAVPNVLSRSCPRATTWSLPTS